MTLSPRLPSRIWTMQKEIKDAYPKKVCHMPTRLEKKDAYPKKVCHMPTRHAKKKEEEEEKDSPYPRKKGRKRDRANKFIHHPPNKNYPHTCTS